MNPYPPRLKPKNWKKFVQSGDRLFIGSGPSCPHTLVESLLDHSEGMYDLEMVHILTLGDTSWSHPDYRERVKVNALFLGPDTRKAVQTGRADYTPCFLSEIPSLFTEGILPLDVALIQVSPPDAYGYCSLGVCVDIVRAAAKAARVVIAQVNEQMPRTLGQSFLHISEIDACLRVEEPLPELKTPKLGEETLRIGEYVAMLIENGATLQMGIGKIPDAVLKALGDHKDLGVHTEMFSDGVIDLIKKGVINNRKKSLHPGKIVTTFCMGSRELYDFVHENPHVEFHPSEYVNSPRVIAENDNMVAINSAIEVDLTGQVVADSLGYKFYSGIGGQVDFIRGASMSRGGRPIIALPSTTPDGKISRITAHIKEGAGVVTSRGDVHYVVTEYGIATLRGRSVRERALELIQVAHPKFRDGLLDEVQKQFRIPALKREQPSLVKELGGVRMKKLKFKDGAFFLRPLAASDDRRLQEFFYSHEQETLTERYRGGAKRLSGEQAHQLVSVDQSRDAALCLVSRQGPREEIQGVGRYYLAKNRKSAEVAVVVRERRRGQGMARKLLKTLSGIAKKRGVKKLVAYVPLHQGALLHLYRMAGYKRSKTAPDGDVTLELNLQEG